MMVRYGPGMIPEWSQKDGPVWYLYGMVWYGMVWYGMVRYGMVQHTVGIPNRELCP